MLYKALKKIQKTYKRIIAKLKIRGLKISRDKVLIFIGAPRTGSTFIGQILNNHPECLISTESYLIQNIIMKGHRFKHELEESILKAYQQYLFGIYSGPLNFRLRRRYQRKWQEVDPPRNKMKTKENVKVVGDKKAGGTTKAYIFDKEKMMHLVHNHPEIVFIHIVRNPIDSALSYVKSHPHEVSNFEEAINEIIRLQEAATVFLERTDNDYIRVFYEDVLEEPEKELLRICKWLGIDTSGDLLESLSGVVNTSNGRNIDKSEYISTLTRILQKKQIPALNRYLP